MGPNEKARLKLRDTVQGAIAEYFEGGVPAPEGDVNSGNCHLKLNPLLVVQGVVVMNASLNLVAGSSGEFNLYKLVNAYLLDLGARERINRLLAA